MNKASILNRLEKAENDKDMLETQHIIVDHKNFIIRAPNTSRPCDYYPSATMLEFHKSQKRIRFVVGPYGSGKTTGLVHEILFHATSMPRMKDGVRRAKYAFVRNTYAELESTTLRTWLDWCDDLGIVKRSKKPIYSLVHTFNDGYGIIEIEVIFLALDREQDVKKVKSLELTGALLNEVSEINNAVYNHLTARIGRYPNKEALDGPYKPIIIADTNPPDEDHWIPRLEKKMPSNFGLWHQPPGILKDEKGNWHENKERDNAARTSGYYQQMVVGKDEEFIRVFCQGKYGTVISGKPVYPGYNDDLHSIPTIDISDNTDIIIAWDYGTVCPACVICEYDNGRLYAMKEFIGDYITVKEIAQNIVVPYLNTNYKNRTYYCVGDPANTSDGRGQLKECGIEAHNAQTNKIETRIAAVSNFMSTLIGGKAALVVSREGCPKLRQGFIGKYNYKRLRVIGDEKYRDEPDKTHPFSDIHDALQYACLYYTKTAINNDKKLDYRQFMAS